MQKTFKRAITDRYDGWRVRNVDGNFFVIPYIMRTRIDSQNLFEERISLEPMEAFIRAHRNDIPELSIMHILLAAMVRLMALRPRLNRFVVWNKIFARNTITFSLIIKRSLSDDGEETPIKPAFDPTDTIYDVTRKVKEEVERTRPLENRNEADRLTHVLGYLPAFLMRFVVWLLRWLDNLGFLPRFIHKASPWHASAFLTNMGSIGIDPIYHHLNEFGTCSIFVAMGKKRRHTVHDADGTTRTEKSIGLRFVTDERICDGFYYATSMKIMRRILLHPEVLLQPPEKVVIDDGVPEKKRIL
jgi:hypothetical protein